MKLRQATLEDRDQILKITDLLRLDISNFVWATPEYITRQINTGEYFVGEEDNRTIAIISFRPRHGILYIETLAVAPDRQRSGLGSQLIEFAKEYTRTNGFTTLRACAFFEYGNGNFYLKHGFSPVGKPGAYSNHNFYRFELKL